MKPARFDAMVQCAVEDEHGFESIKVTDLKEIFSRVEKIISIENLYPRMLHSRDPALMMTWLLALPSYRRLDNLEKLMQLMRRCPEIDFRAQAELSDLVANQYWSIRVRTRIHQHDYRRAWDEIKKSFCGFDPMPHEPGHPPNRGEMPVTNSLFREFTFELYQLMVSLELVPSIATDFSALPRHVSLTWFDRIPAVSGWPLVVASGGVDRKRSVLNRHGQMILSICQYLNQEKKLRKQRKASYK